jgi:hypothetical protein
MHNHDSMQGGLPFGATIRLMSRPERSVRPDGHMVVAAGDGAGLLDILNLRHISDLRARIS